MGPEEANVKYLLLHYVVEDTLPDARAEATADGTLAAWLNETTASGINLDGAHLVPASEAAAVVATVDGETLVSDGPFTETKEQIAGFDIIECGSFAEAVQIAGTHPTARRFGSIEVRAIWEG
jgi:hypothetical protein